ncbi:L,D-transpeptidase family protein [Propionibacteriaceae bacterium Y1923]
MSRVVKSVALLGVLALALSGCAKDLSGSPHLPSTTTAPAATPDPSGMPSPDRPATTTSSPDATPTPPSPEPTTDAPTTDAPTTTPPTATAAPTKAPAILKRGDSGEKVRELQHRLLQIDWFDGLITPDYGQQTQVAVQGFQGKRGLATTGEVDQATWDALVKMTKQPTHDQMHNILRPGPALLKSGDSGDKVRDLQARLKQVAWYEKLVDGSYGAATVAAVKGFQGKRGIPVTGEVDQRTLDRLNAMTSKPTVEELTNKPPKKATGNIDPRCMTGRVLCISKSSNKINWVVNGQVLKTMDVRFGSELTPTREGVFTLYWKSRNHHSTIYDTPMPYAMFFSGGQAVHYSADFAARGYNGASHGCVNVRDKDGIVWLFDQTREGDKVIVYR